MVTEVSYIGDIVYKGTNGAYITIVNPAFERNPSAYRATSNQMLITSAGVTAYPWVFFIADFGYGSDSIFSYNFVELADFGHSLTQNVIVVPHIFLVDAGTGREVGVIKVKLFMAESGHGSDVLSITANLTLTDPRHGSDFISILRKIFPSDTGHGTESTTLTLILPVQVDSGMGQSTMNISVALNLQDIAHGLDILTRIFELSDSGHGVELALPIKSFFKVDSGTGGDIVNLIEIISVSDSGHATETFSERRTTVIEKGITNEVVTIISKFQATRLGIYNRNLTLVIVEE